MHEKIVIDVQERKICAVLHLPNRAPRGWVITCHGLFSSKDSDKFTTAAQQFTAAGFSVVRFDFSGCGESSGSIAETTITRRLQELRAVVSFFQRQADIGQNVCLFGSSLGGYLSLLYAAEQPRAILSLWATPFDLTEIAAHLPEEQLKLLKQEFFFDAQHYRVDSVLGALSCVQIIHGKHDTIVPWHHAEKIFATVNNPKELILLPKGDHSLSSIDDRTTALHKTLAWFLHFT